jgi:hypothetical protein
MGCDLTCRQRGVGQVVELVGGHVLDDVDAGPAIRRRVKVPECVPASRWASFGGRSFGPFPGVLLLYCLRTRSSVKVS